MNKICTTIEQSKKLLELGIDISTADMMWEDWSLIDDEWKLSVGYDPEIEKDYGRKCYPAWSLVALLNGLPNPSLHKTFNGWRCEAYDKEGTCFMLGESFDNSIDACVEMIIRSYEKTSL